MLFRDFTQNLESMDNLKPIDWQETIKLVNNKPKLAEEMLAMLIAELPTTRSSIITAMESKDHKLLHKHVHRLHGACCYIALPKLKAIIIQLENILKSKEKQEPKEQINQLLAEIERVLLAYRADNFRA